MSLKPVEIHGIKFFDRPHDCIEHFETLHWTKKALSLIQSFGTLLAYALHRAMLALKRTEARMDPLTHTHQRALSKKRLVVCIHGLNNNPAQFAKLVYEMQQKDLGETDLLIPRVLQKGNAKLDEMVKPILEEIAKWAKTSDEKELVLVGVSNGGRISRAIETEIGKFENDYKTINKLRFISIVGACQGSSLVDVANRLGLSCLMSKNISEEMPESSKRNRRLGHEWTDGLSKGPNREHTFIASPHDWQVTNYSSTLLYGCRQTAKYAIVPGHGHNSIVNAVSKTVAEIIFQKPTA